nr:uncharacterized protein LOC129266963 [Lytechinus pictus]
MGLNAPHKELSGSSQPSELSDALSDTQRLHVFDQYGWHVYNRHGNTDRYLRLEHYTSEVFVIGYGREYHGRISWNIDDDEAWIVFKDELPLHLTEMISALAPLCQKVEHITCFGKDLDIHTHGSQPFIPMRSVLTVCLRSMFAPLDASLWTVMTEKQESQESSEESQEGAGIPSKLDKASSQTLKTSAIDKLSEVKVKFHEDTGSQNPEGGEEETSWQEKEEEFDVNQESLPNETVPDERDVKTTKKECCKRIGADGGRLRLESFGIELEIPPGAIGKEPQEISLRVLTDTPNIGDTKEEMSVCFGVQCLAPDDLVLRSPVTFSIPHCAVATLYFSLKAVLYTGEGEYSPHAVIKERKVLSSSGIPSCKIMKDVLELKMDHFSWAKIMIRIKNFFFRGKRMCFVPFKEKYLSLAKTPLILHANFYDDVEGNKEVSLTISLF